MCIDWPPCIDTFTEMTYAKHDGINNSEYKNVNDTGANLLYCCDHEVLNAVMNCNAI